MKFVDYFKDIMLRKKDNYVVVSDGGMGKTTSLIEIYRMVLAEKLYCEGQRVIPIYVPLSQCGHSGDHSVMEYIVLNYTYHENDGGDSLKLQIKQFEELIFDRENSGYCYLLLLDAINENYFGNNLLNEIYEISGKENVFTILTGRYRISQLSSWKTVHLCTLSDEVVNRVAGNNPLDESERSLLKNPFYLSKYAAMAEDRQALAGIRINEYSLLSSYYSWILQKQKKANSSLVFDGNETYSEQAFDVCESLLPFLAFEACRDNSMFIEIDAARGEEAMSVFRHSDASHREQLADRVSRQIIESLLERYCVPTGLLTNESGRYKFSHEIYRDYLCSKYICEIIKSGKPLSGPNFRCSADVMKMTANGTIQKPRFADREGKVLVTFDEVCTLFFPDRDNTENGFFNYCFLLYNLIESYRNGSREKKEFCLNMSGISRNMYAGVRALLSTKDKLSEEEVKLAEVIRIHAEILRRSAEYDEAISAIGFLGEISVRFPEKIANEYSTHARHVRVKCGLYAAFDEAKSAGGEVSETACRTYLQKLSELKYLCDEGYTPSRNLFAMMLAYPDGVSKRYVAKYCGDAPMEERRRTAFEINYGSMIKEFIKENNASSYYYPMQQCLTALLHGDISCMCDPGLLRFLGLKELISGGEMIFRQYTEGMEDTTSAVIDMLLDHLMKIKNADILHCLRAKSLVRRGKLDSDVLYTSLDKSSNIPLSMFMRSLITKDNDVAIINTIKKKLTESAGSRSLDSFDAIYVKEDLEAMWDLFKNEEYSEEYRAAVNEMLDLDLKES